MTTKQFRNKFLTLIIATWGVPPIFGLSYLVYIQMFSIEQMIDIMLSPIEPFFIICALAISIIIFHRWCRPIMSCIDNATPENQIRAIHAIKIFPFLYWSIFVGYLVIAPITVIVSAELFSDFVATPIDWFRINLVSLVVSIVVGLPIFFMVYDLIGKVSYCLSFSKPFIAIRTKVFLIGALTPLLIDTMIVQYYWTKTGYFTGETFIVWLSLEILAISGSLIFVRSFAQSLKPLEHTIANDNILQDDKLLKSMKSMSTDELGLLTNRYQAVLEKLHEQQNKLEEKVSVRTKELQNSNQELEAFCSAVSHDLRAPLRHIHGYSDILLEEYNESLDLRGKQYLNKINNASEKMSELISSLLGLSRITRSELQKQKINISNIAFATIDELTLYYPERAIDINISTDLEAFADKKLIQIVLHNLFDNAIKYSKHQNPAKIEFGYNLSNHAFFVNDNGVGFDNRFVKKIFEPFQRQHSDSEYEGIGIGLATVLRIINKHEGKIWAESQIGQGTCFYFTLPGA